MEEAMKGRIFSCKTRGPGAGFLPLLMPGALMVPCLAVLLLSCQSLQKDLLVTSRGVEEESFGEIEELIVRLETAELPRREEIAGLRGKVTAMEKQTGGDFDGRLAAWSGRIFLLERKPQDALRELGRSQSLAPGNLPALLLAIRLERDKEKALAMEAEESAGEVLIEKGRILFELSRFPEAVAAFDTAFNRLKEKPYYEECYRPRRDKSWELRDIRGMESGSVRIAGKEELSWGDLIELTSGETRLLQFITAGKGWPTEELFSHLLDRGFIPLTQDIARSEWPLSKPRMNEQVLRAGAAWFLWHLYAESRANKGLLSRYSSRYNRPPSAGGTPRGSPIPDLPLLSPYFDSVLGCVESEFMALPDGKNFVPSEGLRGSAFLGMLKKLGP
jgi:tetratricopeptide (TPR) repeat protein